MLENITLLEELEHELSAHFWIHPKFKDMHFKIPRKMFKL